MNVRKLNINRVAPHPTVVTTTNLAARRKIAKNLQRRLRVAKVVVTDLPRVAAEAEVAADDGVIHPAQLPALPPHLQHLVDPAISHEVAHRFQKNQPRDEANLDHIRVMSGVRPKEKQIKGRRKDVKNRKVAVILRVMKRRTMTMMMRVVIYQSTIFSMTMISTCKLLKNKAHITTSSTEAFKSIFITILLRFSFSLKKIRRHP